MAKELTFQISSSDVDSFYRKNKGANNSDPSCLKYSPAMGFGLVCFAGNETFTPNNLLSYNGEKMLVTGNNQHPTDSGGYKIENTCNKVFWG